MNKVILIGRLTKDPIITYREDMAIGRYTLAVDRKKDGADFLNCVAFGKGAEFAERYLHKGMKIAVTGRIQTGSYKNKDGNTVYTTDIIVEEHEFVEKRSEAQESPNKAAEDNRQGNYRASQNDGFMAIPDGVDDYALPFN